MPHGREPTPGWSVGRAVRPGWSAWWTAMGWHGGRPVGQGGPVTNPESTGGDVRIERVDVADERAVAAHYDVMRASYQHAGVDQTMPTLPEVLALLRSEREAIATEVWLMRVADEVVGTYVMELSLLDNTDLVALRLAVHPEHEHRGYGRRLVQHVRRRAAELGRHQVNTQLDEPLDGSRNRAMRFAEASGARRSLGEMHRVLDLELIDRQRLSALGAEAQSRAAGYELVAWTGPCPDDLVDDYAALIGRLTTDAPTGESGVQTERWDAARVRERDVLMETQGRRSVATAARLGADGPLVAYSDIVTTRHDPDNAYQWDTLVLREHRGRRLGALVKVANLERLMVEAPDARRVHTWNADENVHMIAINEAMGFVAAGREAVWRLDLPD